MKKNTPYKKRQKLACTYGEKRAMSLSGIGSGAKEGHARLYKTEREKEKSFEEHVTKI